MKGKSIWKNYDISSKWYNIWLFFFVYGLFQQLFRESVIYVIQSISSLVTYYIACSYPKS